MKLNTGHNKYNICIELQVRRGVEKVLKFELDVDTLWP